MNLILFKNNLVFWDKISFIGLAPIFQESNMTSEEPESDDELTSHILRPLMRTKRDLVKKWEKILKFDEIFWFPSKMNFYFSSQFFFRNKIHWIPTFEWHHAQIRGKLLLATHSWTFGEVFLNLFWFAAPFVLFRIIWRHP